MYVYVQSCNYVHVYNVMYNSDRCNVCTAQPRLSGPRLSGTSIIRNLKIHYHAYAEYVTDDI
jgi:hypothetical protein